MVTLAAFVVTPSDAAEKVLYSFSGGNDGIGPQAALISDSFGDFIGTTAGGGGGTHCQNSVGCGTVFQIAPDGTETVLHAFGGACDGGDPRAGVVADKTGNFYGTTQIGGICNNDLGYGTIYKLAPDGTESVLYAFGDGTDGAYPSWNLLIDGKGNLYGASEGGGQNQCCGVLFQVTPKGKLNILHTFVGGSEGAGPEGSMVRDKLGNIYGATGGGGGGGCGFGGGCGTVFKLAPDGTLTTIYAFQGGSDGELPEFGVAMDGAGNFYGTTLTGGAGDLGVVFKVMPDGTETTLHAFVGGTDGAFPEAGVIVDKSGNVYGTTYYGGGTGCHGTGCGTVFKVAPDGTETIVATIGGKRGQFPTAPVLLKKGELYGTTSQGGTYKDGVVFSVKP